MEKYVVGIGAANVDIYGKSNINIKLHFDHPSIINTGVGGVTRNILENISLLGIKTVLLTAIGDDIYGHLIRSKSIKAGIDVSNVKKVKGARSGIFMQVQDKNNDMHLALCDMSINKHINIPYIKKNSKIIKNASAIILDPSISDEVFEYVLNNFDVRVFVDPVSVAYAKKMKKYTGKMYCIKPNISELEALTGTKVNNDTEIKKAANKLIKKGTKRLFVSLGAKGCVYIDNEGNYIKRGFKKVKNMVNASGAGDCFFAAIVYSYITDLNISDTIDKALAAGIVATQSKEAINQKLSISLLNKTIKEYKNEL